MHILRQNKSSTLLLRDQRSTISLFPALVRESLLDNDGMEEMMLAFPDRSSEAIPTDIGHSGIPTYYCRASADSAFGYFARTLEMSVITKMHGG